MVEFIAFEKIIIQFMFFFYKNIIYVRLVDTIMWLNLINECIIQHLRNYT